MKTVTVKNTYDIQLSGKPSVECTTLTESSKEVAVLPNAIPHFKPKMAVKEGDIVKIGTPIFFDKRYPRIQFVSPGAGAVSKIHYGPKRVVEKVIIQLADTEEEATFASYSKDNIAALDRNALVEAITQGGLWGVFKEFPFQRIPNPEAIPPIIYVNIDNDEPYYPESSVYLKGKESLFEIGIMALRQLAAHVVVSKSVRNQSLSNEVMSLVTHDIEGHYPANQPGVVLYHTKSTQKDNASWGIDGQDVIRLATLLTTGHYPKEKVVVVAGALISNPKHMLVREGVSVSALLQDNPVTEEPARYIAGGVFTGRKIDQNGFLGFQDKALHVIREGKPAEMLTFFRPGFDKPTFSRTYFSALIKNAMWKMTSSLNGGHRACISCSECPKVCPVGLYPQLLMKNIYANDLEESLKLGLLDCVECGLCSYVCPSKIDIDDMIISMKSKLEKETHS